MDKCGPFVRGQFRLGMRNIQALDTVRSRPFPYEMWYPVLRNTRVSKHRSLEMRRNDGKTR
jgi:hypothetical protein